MSPDDQRKALIELIEAIDAVSAFIDLEAGQGGYGPVVRACEVAGIPVPPRLTAWLAEDGIEPGEEEE